MIYERGKDELYKLLISKGFKDSNVDNTRLEWDLVKFFPAYNTYVSFDYCRFDESVLFVANRIEKHVEYNFTFHDYGYIIDDGYKAKTVLDQALSLLDRILESNDAEDIRKQINNQ